MYEHIYTEHHQEALVEYTLNASARKVYLKYCKGKSNMQSSAGAFKPECKGKISGNALSLALNLHLLWHWLDKVLNKHDILNGDLQY